MTEVVLTCSTEDAWAIECTLFIWVLQVKIKTFWFTVVKWTVFMDYSHTGVVTNTYPERGLLLTFLVLILQTILYWWSFDVHKHILKCSSNTNPRGQGSSVICIWRSMNCEAIDEERKLLVTGSFINPLSGMLNLSMHWEVYYFHFIGGSDVIMLSLCNFL